MEIRRIVKIEGAIPSTDRKAMLLRCVDSDGATFGLEATPDNLTHMLRGLLLLARQQAAAGLPAARPAPSVLPSETVAMNAEGIDVRPQSDGTVWMFFPVGTVTLSTMFETRAAASAVAGKILQAANPG